MQQFEKQSLLVVIHGRGGMIFDPVVESRSLNFELYEGQMRDMETHSIWRFSGIAISGPLQGKQLKKFPVRSSYWFAIAATEKNIIVKKI